MKNKLKLTFIFYFVCQFHKYMNIFIYFININKYFSNEFYFFSCLLFLSPELKS